MARMMAGESCVGLNREKNSRLIARDATSGTIKLAFAMVAASLDGSTGLAIRRHASRTLGCGPPG